MNCMRLSMSLVKHQQDREEGNIGDNIADEARWQAGISSISVYHFMNLREAAEMLLESTRQCRAARSALTRITIRSCKPSGVLLG